MKELLQEGIKYLQQKGAEYGEIRQVSQEHESIVVRNEVVENISTGTTSGYGIRVLYNGSWGFSCNSKLTSHDMRHTIDIATEMAKAASLINKEKVNFPPQEAIIGTFKSKYLIDPFEVPLDKKIDYLMWANQILRKHEKIKTATSAMDFFKTNKLFFNTEGSQIEQQIIESGGFVEAIAVLADEFQKRSYPQSHHGQIAQAGYEYVKQLDFVGGAQKCRDEAVMLLRAKELPFMKTALILEGSQLALQVHESCGHPIELDRVLGEEVSYAGTSFLTPEKLGNFRYGSDLVNITADPTVEGGAGSFGYDDEGTKASRTPIVEKGIFCGYLSSRETAAKIGRKSSAAMRAQSWYAIPIVRMTNVNLEPGDATLDQLIADTKDGIYMCTNKSWSIDDKRLNFQFGTEIAWEIKNGKLGQMYKNPVYTGITPEFWNSCSGICNKNHWKIWGVPNCGKGEPVQTMHVGHGTAPARFENVQVGRKS